MNIYLERYGSTPMGTFGELIIGDFKFHTVERPWLDNKPFVSCIPDGEYKLIPFTRSNGDEVFALINDDITKYKESHSTRYSVLIHKANISDELAGCIAPGVKFGFVKGKRAVLSSGLAMTQIMKLLKYDEEHTLTIEWQNNR